MLNNDVIYTYVIYQSICKYSLSFEIHTLFIFKEKFSDEILQFCYLIRMDKMKNLLYTHSC